MEVELDVHAELACCSVTPIPWHTFDITCRASNAVWLPSLSTLMSWLPSLATLSKNLITLWVHFVNYRNETLRQFSLHQSLLLSSLFLHLFPPLPSSFLLLSSLLQQAKKGVIFVSFPISTWCGSSMTLSLILMWRSRQQVPPWHNGFIERQ